MGHSQPEGQKPWACACCAMEAAELAQTLRDKGLPLPEGILTVSDMVKELKDVLCPSK